jgi:3-oxoacyl-[acyl-carrier-protein] synthase-1/3-oxoacyl-[acyl-carrier-protein] synthase II
MAEPLRFPYTSPNAVAGECSLAFRMSGPSFSVGSGSRAGLEALAAAHALVAGGDVDRVVVVAADEVGPVARRIAPGIAAGAVALLVSSSRVGPRVARIALPLVESPLAHAAHAPLVALAKTELSPSPRRLTDDGAVIELDVPG